MYFLVKSQQKKTILIKTVFSYKVLPHANNIIDFFKKSKFFDTFYKMSMIYKIACFFGGGQLYL